MGKTKVNWNCFTNDTTIAITRPPQNKLPLVNFSYQPLFRCLSIPNVLVLWGILLQEGRVVLCSKHTALLTPVAGSLLSLLFPLNWQSMYIPVLPNHMVDVLKALVPFLVGLHEPCPAYPPPGVVICDLDLDDSVSPHPPRAAPALPARNAIRLKIELEEVAYSLYLIPPCGIKGRMRNGMDCRELINSKREPYAHIMTRDRLPSSTKLHREYILSSADDSVQGFFQANLSTRAISQQSKSIGREFAVCQEHSWDTNVWALFAQVFDTPQIVWRARHSGTQHFHLEWRPCHTIFGRNTMESEKGHYTCSSL